ncbi:MAG: hypothetical protein L0Z50_21005 [Verrucomicrobiales bacterium]|nr:hypothetical protein [Verrucomicrobiales bacterium]
MAREDKSIETIADYFLADLHQNNGALRSAEAVALFEYLEIVGLFKPGRHANASWMMWSFDPEILSGAAVDQAEGQVKPHRRPRPVRSAATAPSLWDEC